MENVFSFETRTASLVSAPDVMKSGYWFASVSVYYLMQKQWKCHGLSTASGGRLALWQSILAGEKVLRALKPNHFNIKSDGNKYLDFMFVE